MILLELSDTQWLSSNRSCALFFLLWVLRSALPWPLGLSLRPVVSYLGYRFLLLRLFHDSIMSASVWVSAPAVASVVLVRVLTLVESIGTVATTATV